MKGLEKGIIPVEKETLAQFEKRLAAFTPHESQNFPPAQKALQRTEDLFGFRASWIPIHFHDKNLAFFEAGAAFLKNKGRLGFIQIRKRFRKNNRLFFCTLEEVIAHEMVHIVRSQVKGDRFEEIFAYKTSKSKIRKLLGPLFDTTIETLIFLLAILLAELSYPFANYFFALPLVFVSGFFGVRLFLRARVFKKAEKKLKNPSLLIAMTDEEITLLAKAKDLESFLSVLRENTLRTTMLQSQGVIS